MKEVKNVLSLFNGMGCNNMALDLLGIKPDNIYTSEVDKFALALEQKLYPDNLQIGDVRDVDVSKLPPIDLVVGGSPCQSFSFAGQHNVGMTEAVKDIDIEDTYVSKTTMNGTVKETVKLDIVTLEQYLELKEQEFQFKGYSYLFWEFARILYDIREYNPDVLFLLENVKMSKKWEKVLTEAVGHSLTKINSSLVSPQNRERLYWTNLGDTIPQPEDRGLLLRDILEDGMAGENPAKHTERNLRHVKHAGLKSLCVTATSYKGCGNNGVTIIPVAGTSYIEETITGGAFRGRCFDENGTRMDHKQKVAGQCVQQLEPREDGKSNALTTVQKDNVVAVIQRCIQVGNADLNGHESIKRVYSPDGKSPCLNSMGGGNREPKVEVLPEDAEVLSLKHNIRTGKYTHYEGPTNYKEEVGKMLWRKLTVKECMRLQMVPEEIIEQMLESGTSNSQLYRMCGNGWNVTTIQHIYKHLLGVSDVPS